MTRPGIEYIYIYILLEKKGRIYIYIYIYTKQIRLCLGVHRRTSLTSSSFLFQQYPACLVRLTRMDFEMGDIYTHIDKYIYLFHVLHTHTHTHTYIYTYRYYVSHTCINTYICTHIYIYVCINKKIYIYIYYVSYIYFYFIMQKE